MPNQQSWGYVGNARWLTLLATPLFLCGSFLMVMPWDYYNITLLFAGFSAFFAAQADGWGRQMDLGTDHKPDDETGHRFRNKFFDSPSSYLRDLVGMYMRTAQFLPSAIAFGLINPWYAVPSLVVTFGAPIVWVLEDLAYRHKTPPFALVEFFIGVLMCVATVAALFFGQ